MSALAPTASTPRSGRPSARPAPLVARSRALAAGRAAASLSLIRASMAASRISSHRSRSLRQGSYREAEESLRGALELQPEDPEIHYAIGMLYAQQNLMLQAEEYLQ